MVGRPVAHAQISPEVSKSSLCASLSASNQLTKYPLCHVSAVIFIMNKVIERLHAFTYRIGES